MKVRIVLSDGCGTAGSADLLGRCKILSNVEHWTIQDDYDLSSRSACVCRKPTLEAPVQRILYQAFARNLRVILETASGTNECKDLLSEIVKHWKTERTLEVYELRKEYNHVAKSRS